MASEGNFTEAIGELERAGYNSLGFTIDRGAISCAECGSDNPPDTVGVGGMLRYQGTLGEGHVFALGCPACARKGLLFVGPDVAAEFGDVVDGLGQRARAYAS